MVNLYKLVMNLASQVIELCAFNFGSVFLRTRTLISCIKCMNMKEYLQYSSDTKYVRIERK